VHVSIHVPLTAYFKEQINMAKYFRTVAKLNSILGIRSMPSVIYKIKFKGHRNNTTNVFPDLQTLLSVTRGKLRALGISYTRAHFNTIWNNV